MKRKLWFQSAAFAALLAAPCFGGKDHTLLNPKIIAAKSACIQNLASTTLDDETYKELKRWKRWEIVDNRTMADLVVIVSSPVSPPAPGGTQPCGPGGKPGSKHSGNFVCLELLDAKSGASVYRASGKTVQDIIRELAKRIEKQEEQNDRQSP
ncbi:MAG TPA: hypothetical protein VEI54_05055 [Candidatus Limnocylindrales bacterium]|nr:hypothetical protein [Candidatus Limnocylindrales bacterium]